MCIVINEQILVLCFVMPYARGKWYSSKNTTKNNQKRVISINCIIINIHNIFLRVRTIIQNRVEMNVHHTKS